MNTFQAKVAVVTGGGSGIGEATAKRLAFQGARVVIADINSAGAERVVQQIAAAGGSATAYVVDVADEAGVMGMVQHAMRTFGHLDLLHNNAAVISTKHMARDKLVTDMDVEIWDRTMAVNVRGVMLGCKHAIPEMIKRGGGAIVNMSSVASLFGAMQDVAYGTSKAAIEALTRYVAAQYGKQGVRCNAVLPSVTLTPAVKSNIPAALMDVLREYGNCLPYFAEPDDLARVITFLLSDDARHVTGQAIAADGGYSVPSAAGAVVRYAFRQSAEGRD